MDTSTSSQQGDDEARLVVSKINVGNLSVTHVNSILLDLLSTDDSHTWGVGTNLSHQESFLFDSICIRADRKAIFGIFPGITAMKMG